MPAGGQDGIGDQPHQPDPAAAENQPDVGRRQAAAELAGGIVVSSIDRAGRAAIDANAPDLLHSGFALCQGRGFSSSDRAIIARACGAT